jgi:hypothetical protein
MSKYKLPTERLRIFCKGTGNNLQVFNLPNKLKFEKSQFAGTVPVTQIRTTRTGTNS